MPQSSAFARVPNVNVICRPAHLQQLAKILKVWRGPPCIAQRLGGMRLAGTCTAACHLFLLFQDPDASANDKFVALELLKNANVAAGMVLPSCQDTGTAIIMGKRGQQVHRKKSAALQPSHAAATRD